MGASPCREDGEGVALVVVLFFPQMTFARSIRRPQSTGVLKPGPAGGVQRQRTDHPESGFWLAEPGASLPPCRRPFNGFNCNLEAGWVRPKRRRGNIGNPRIHRIVPAAKCASYHGDVPLDGESHGPSVSLSVVDNQRCRPTLRRPKPHHHTLSLTGRSVGVVEGECPASMLLTRK
jgi:hypothetical protein